MEVSTFKCTTLQDAWFQLVYSLMRGDSPKTVYTIDKGSYVGQQRLEFDYVTVQIDQPGAKPLIPEIPPQLNIPAPVEDMGYVEDYFAKYLMSTEVEENETYIYGTWLAPGVERVIEQLNGAPGNNQGVISIGGWAPSKYSISLSDIGLPEKEGAKYNASLDTDNFIDPATNERDPACLRTVDFRYDQEGYLHMVVYFRSWDLWGGFPANLAGLQLVKEYVGQAIGAKDGKIIASSKGLHMYDHAILIAAERLGMQDVSDLSSLNDFLDAIGNKNG